MEENMTEIQLNNPYKAESWSFYHNGNANLGNNIWLNIVDYSGSGKVSCCIWANSAIEFSYLEVTIDGSVETYDLTGIVHQNEVTNYGVGDFFGNIIPLEFQTSFVMRTKHTTGGGTHHSGNAHIMHQSPEFQRVIYQAGESIPGRTTVYDEPVMMIKYCHYMVNGIPMEPYTDALIFLPAPKTYINYDNEGNVTGKLYKNKFDERVGKPQYKQVRDNETSRIEKVILKDKEEYVVTIEKGKLVDTDLPKLPDTAVRAKTIWNRLNRNQKRILLTSDDVDIKILAQDIKNNAMVDLNDIGFKMTKNKIIEEANKL